MSVGKPSLLCWDSFQAQPWGQTLLIPGDSGLTAAISGSLLQQPPGPGSLWGLLTHGSIAVARQCHTGRKYFGLVPDALCIGAGPEHPVGLVGPHPGEVSHHALGYGAANPRCLFCLCFACPGSRVWARAGAGLSLLPAGLGLVEDRRTHCRERRHRSVAEGAPSAGIWQLPQCWGRRALRTCVHGGEGAWDLAGMWAMHAAAGLLPGHGPARVTLAHAIPPLSAGCPEPVREDICSHPRGVPGGAAEAHDRLGAHWLQTLGPQGTATAQSLR